MERIKKLSEDSQILVESFSSSSSHSQAHEGQLFDILPCLPSVLSLEGLRSNKMLRGSSLTLMKGGSI